MTVLCYLGPSLDIATAKSICPDAIFLPPARHADLVSHVYQYNPSHVLLIDGDFNHVLPVWHKECAFCAMKGVRLYGASSMGALRASELADFGIMIGCGTIFHWYWEGLCEADDEVAVCYHKSPSGEYVCDTCPLVNIRAGLIKQVNLGLMTQDEADEELRLQRSIHYTERPKPDYAIDQKREDAIRLLSTFRELEYHTHVRPDISYLTHILHALVERERRIEHAGAVITTQNIDSYISLHCPEHNQILWDSKNRSLVLILCDILNVQIDKEDVEKEWTTFCARHRLTTWESFQSWLQSNATTQEEFMVLIIQNARIKKIQRAYASTKNWSRQTQTILDYMRSHNVLQVWLDDCADCERKIVDKSNDESFSLDFGVPIENLLREHFDVTGLEISGSIEDFLRDTGIGGLDELRVCLERYALARNSR